MSFWKNRKLHQKFTIAGGISTLLLCLSLIASVYGIKRIDSGFSSYVENDQAAVLALKEMYAHGLQAEQATRNILLNPADQKAADNYRQAMEEFEKAAGVVSAKSIDMQEAKPQLESLMATWKNAALLREQVQTLAREGKREEAMNLLNKEETPKWREVKEKLFRLSGERMKKLDAGRAAISDLSNKTLVASLGLGLLAIISTIVLISAVVFGLTRSIRTMGAMVDDIARGEGDLTKRLPVSGHDEFGRLSESFNQFIEKLQRVVQEISHITGQVSAAAAEVSATAEQMATGTEEVACQSATVATAGEEMSVTSREIAQNCMAAAEGSKRASETASAGAIVVHQTVQGMERIAERVKESARTVESLGAKSDQIGTIIGTIEDIADQTNLLALNAAIEAARAGEQGRGFAVVADEVRALAERTTKATKEIGVMIKAIQGETLNAVGIIEEGVQEVGKGTEEASKSGEALREIIAQIEQVTQQVNQIAVAAEEQTATTSEISNNMQQITGVVNETASGAQQSAEAARQLSGLAASLASVVHQFKLS